MAKSFFPNLKCEICSTKFSGRFCRVKRTCSKECLHILRSKTNGRPKGSKWSEEQTQKMSVMFSGTNNPFYGKTHTIEARAKISSSLKKSTGVDSRRWKGGVSKGYKTGYYSSEYKQWRVTVFERDNYICQDCGVRGCYLTAHHIKSFAHFPELRFELSNGKTLCESCHSLTDNYKGRAKKLLKTTLIN